MALPALTRTPARRAAQLLDDAADLAAADDLVDLDRVAGREEQLLALGQLDGRLVGLAAGDLDPPRAGLAGQDLDHAVDVADLRLALGDARLEELLDARQAGRDVEPGDTAGVERAHRQLRAGLADRLGGDDADRLAGTDEVAGGQVAAVAEAADAVSAWQLSGERTATSAKAAEPSFDAQAGDAQGDGLLDLLVALDEDLAGLGRRVGDGGRRERPTMRLAKSSSAEPANSRVSSRVIQVPSSVPQSSSRVMTSWATSTRRRVR